MALIYDRKLSVQQDIYEDLAYDHFSVLSGAHLPSINSMLKSKILYLPCQWVVVSSVMMEASDWLKSRPRKRLRHISMASLLKNV